MNKTKYWIVCWLNTPGNNGQKYQGTFYFVKYLSVIHYFQLYYEVCYEVCLDINYLYNSSPYIREVSGSLACQREERAERH